MAELGAFFGNPNIQRQGARARALAGQRDVNTLADPRTYAIVQGLLGTAPDQMGLSVLNPDYEKIRKAAEPAFALGLLGQASPLLAPLTKGLPVGASIKNVGKFDVVKRDASDIFGEGAQRIRYIDPKSNGQIEVLARQDGTASVLSLEVPEKFRGKKIGESLQKQVLEDFPDMQGQVSSKAAATTAYRIGRRPVDMPDATLKDVHKMIDEDSSVNMISPQMQQRISPSASYPQQEALDTAQRNDALPVEEGLLSVQKEQPMQGLLESKIPSPSSLTMPDVPTMEQMQKYGRVETVPLSKAVSFQSARNWDKFNKGEYSGDLVKGFGDKPLALRLENGEYIIYDGNHRTDLAMQAGKTELPMNVIDVKSYDPAHAGRKPVPPSISDDELLRSLLE
jgi:predicted GNAT family acetyltransferase